MGSLIEINDTLQITKAQGFPQELNIRTHLQISYKLEDFEDRIFEFKDKEKVRVYQAEPIRVFLVENISGKWVYWGLCHILEVTCDYVNKTTSGKFKIIYLNTPAEMKLTHHLTDQNPDTDYFKNS